VPPNASPERIIAVNAEIRRFLEAHFPGFEVAYDGQSADLDYQFSLYRGKHPAYTLRVGIEIYRERESFPVNRIYACLVQFALVERLRKAGETLMVRWPDGGSTDVRCA
jgi:hypothetical protein